MAETAAGWQAELRGWQAELRAPRAEVRVDLASLASLRWVSQAPAWLSALHLCSSPRNWERGSRATGSPLCGCRSGDGRLGQDRAR